MFICAVDGTDIVQKDDLSSAHETLVRHNVYMRDGFLFRAANFPTGPRAWVELVDGVPAAVAALYRAAVEAMDPSMRALVASLNAALAEDSPNAQAQSKRRQMIRRIAYWLQSRPEFKGLGLKELEVLVTAVGVGAVHQLEVPKDQLLQVVPKGEG